MSFEQNAEYAPSMKSEAARFVIVAGLPASGKTTFVKEQFDSKSFAVIDDSYRSPFFKTRLNTLFEKDIDTVVCDPYLCNIKYMQDTYKFALKYLKSPSQIFIIYFENDKIQCLENCHRDHLELDIHHFYKNYDETIAYIERLEGPVTMKLKVFRPKVVSNLA
jgi:uridine kinase